jgi:hypothetical protein
MTTYDAASNICRALKDALLFLEVAGGDPGGHAVPRGRAVQVDPIKPTLKVPGAIRLKLKYDRLLSKFAFKCNLRRCTVVFGMVLGPMAGLNPKVGRCRLTL